MISELVLKQVVKLVSKQFKLDKILKYVEEPNELDNEVKHLNKRIDSLEKMSHPPRDFIVCETCKCKVKEKQC
tara:strand:+ start:368 stop:586 length:219 start_codon:yes stop_codon:yes gene_type:complete